MRPVVREATVADARRIAEIHVAGWRFAYRGAMPDALLDGLSVEAREAQHRAGIGDAAGAALQRWVVEIDERVVGWAMAGPSRDADADPRVVGEVYAIYVDPALVGTGAGRALMDCALAALAERGFAEATLLVLEANARARRFYERAGFVADGTSVPATFGGVELREARYRRAL